MKIMAFSDLHHSRQRAEALVSVADEADLVIGAGDFCNMRMGLPEAMNLLSGIQAPMVVVPGNAESDTELRQAAHTDTKVLHGESTDVDGFCVFGLGGGVPVTPFGAWSFDLTEEHAAELLSKCENADILVTHSPPKGAADTTSSGHSVGSRAIRSLIEQVRPSFAFCGHIHDSWGRESRIGNTRVVNLGPFPNWFEL